MMVEVLKFEGKAEAGMLRIALAVLVSGMVAFGGSTSALAQSHANDSSTRANVGPLSPGRAAGIRQAQGQQNNIRNFIPLAVVSGLAILVVVSGGDDDDDTAPTTTGTN